MIMEGILTVARIAPVAAYSGYSRQSKGDNQKQQGYKPQKSFEDSLEDALLSMPTGGKINLRV